MAPVSPLPVDALLVSTPNGLYASSTSLMTPQLVAPAVTHALLLGPTCKHAAQAQCSESAALRNAFLTALSHPPAAAWRGHCILHWGPINAACAEWVRGVIFCSVCEVSCAW